MVFVRRGDAAVNVQPVRAAVQCQPRLFLHLGLQTVQFPRAYVGGIAGDEVEPPPCQRRKEIALNDLRLRTQTAAVFVHHRAGVRAHIRERDLRLRTQLCKAQANGAAAGAEV